MLFSIKNVIARAGVLTVFVPRRVYLVQMVLRAFEQRLVQRHVTGPPAAVIFVFVVHFVVLLVVCQSFIIPIALCRLVGRFYSRTWHCKTCHPCSNTTCTDATNYDSNVDVFPSVSDWGCCCNDALSEFSTTATAG